MRLLLLVFTLAAASCVTFMPEPWDIGHTGPGSVAVIFEREDEERGTLRELFVYRESGSRRIVLPDPRSAHWIGPETLLVALRSDGEGGSRDYLPRVQLHRLDVENGSLLPVGEPGLYFDPSPDPDGDLLAIAVETGELGDSELQIWDLRAPGPPLARREQTLDRPRWSPNGRHLVVSQPRADSDDAEAHEGVTIEGVAITWPRLFRLRRDLTGKLRALHDGEPHGPLAPGGSLPLWWDEQGVWARQREGLMRCNPKGGGCHLIYEPGERRRILDGCAAAGGAWLLVRAGETAGLANEIHRVAIRGWGGSRVWHPPPRAEVAGIDCAD